MKPLQNKKILLIISGGISAYKSLELIRRLKDDGARVQGILTEGGAQFITPLSVSALSGEQALTKLFTQENEHRISHINLSREADLIVIAPASANMIAKMTHGLADTLSSAVLLAAHDKPILLAPAMNHRMWENPATQENIQKLAARGVLQIGPASGDLACGTKGAGRMSEPDEILDFIRKHFAATGPLQGKKALVTSGPTYEPLDPVRFLGNRSSGKQGHAIAAALADQGANVTLVTGPTALPDPEGIQTLHIETARDMLSACLSQTPFDVAVCAAAVADWRPLAVAEEKMKKEGSSPSVAFTENPDILKEIAQKAKDRPALVIGFAAETQDLATYAHKKIICKGCDWLIANEVGLNKAFGCEENEVILLRQNKQGDIGAENWPKCSKKEIAKKLVEEINTFFKSQGSL